MIEIAIIILLVFAIHVVDGVLDMHFAKKYAEKQRRLNNVV